MTSQEAEEVIDFANDNLAEIASLRSALKIERARVVELEKMPRCDQEGDWFRKLVAAEKEVAALRESRDDWSERHAILGESCAAQGAHLNSVQERLDKTEANLAEIKARLMKQREFLADKLRAAEKVLIFIDGEGGCCFGSGSHKRDCPVLEIVRDLNGWKKEVDNLS